MVGANEPGASAFCIRGREFAHRQHQINQADLGTTVSESWSGQGTKERVFADRLGVVVLQRECKGRDARERRNETVRSGAGGTTPPTSQYYRRFTNQFGCVYRWRDLDERMSLCANRRRSSFSSWNRSTGMILRIFPSSRIV